MHRYIDMIHVYVCVYMHGHIYCVYFAATASAGSAQRAWLQRYIYVSTYYLGIHRYIYRYEMYIYVCVCV